MRPSEFVQSRVRRDDLFADPAVFTRRIGAPADDALETGVDPNVVPLGALPHRPRDAQPIERQNAPRIWRPPAEDARQSSHLHREDAPAVGVDDRRGLEIASYVEEVPVRQLRRQREGPSALPDRLRFRGPVRHNPLSCAAEGC